VRFTRRVQALSFAVSAEAGARLASQLHTPLSPDTLLRIVRHTPLPPRATPRVLGVDDFALRKGTVYGTLLVDLERRCPVDVLPDRTATALAQWLRTHPGVDIIARDRSPEYARGARLGAPHARHVADRWHLLHNLCEMIERVVIRRRAQLRRLPNALQLAVSNASAGRPRRLRLPTSSEQARQQESRTQRYNQYAIVHDLLARGLSQRHVARLLGLSRTTVRVFAHAEHFPERALRPPTASNLDPYLSYLLQRWRDGCHNSHQLWREIKTQGYPDGPRQVARWAHQQRTVPAPSTPARYRQQLQPLQLQEAMVEPPPTAPVRLGAPRTVVWLLLRPVETLTPTDRQLLSYILQDAHIARVHTLAQQLQQIIRFRRASQLASWLTDCMDSKVPDLHTFAASLQQDHDAVHAALREEWSSGQVEGHVTRVKFIKRRMYGRAKFDLLRQHILYGD
jgi:transposase